MAEMERAPPATGSRGILDCRRAALCQRAGRDEEMGVFEQRDVLLL
jgi:hypothetical protein